MSKYHNLAKEIITRIGGKDNVIGLVHCITRLRFTLKDENLADDEYLKAMEGVVTVLKSGGQYQVVIGNHVAEVYAEVTALLGGELEGSVPENKKDSKLLDRMIDAVSGIFQPILGVMAACGMLKGLNTLFVTLGLYSAKSGGYLVINAAGDAVFTFLPLFLGYTAAKKFGLKPMLGLAIGAAMCYPGIQGSSISVDAKILFTLFEGTAFASPVYTTFFGLPIIAIDYMGTVIPVILAVWFGAKCEKFFNKIVPDLVKFFFVPMLTLLVVFPLTLLILGPAATFGANLISQFTLAVRGFSPLLAGALVGATWQILVIFGLHWGFIPVYINNVMTLGYDNVMMPFYACTFATSAVVLGMFIKTKNQKLKEMAIPNFISGIFGITEPAIYGMLLPFKIPFIISCIAGGIGGAFYGYFNFRKFIMGGMGIFELPNMMNPDGSMGNLYVALGGIVISMVVGFLLTMIFFKDKKDEKMVEEIIIKSPLSGDVLALSEVDDEAFSSGKMGQGLAIQPINNVVTSPFDGKVSALFPTGHAIAVTNEMGVEVLIHIGKDTVQLDGQGFNPKVKIGEQVKTGQVLIEFDKQLIKKLGYSLTTPIIVTEQAGYAEIILNKEGTITKGTQLLVLKGGKK